MEILTKKDLEEALERVSMKWIEKKAELELLRLSDAAELMKVDIKTAKRFLGPLPKVRVGRQWRIMKGDLESYLNKHKNV
jgi:hypothetical protein